MTSGKRSSLAALVIKATLAENTNRAAICMAILVSSFILIHLDRAAGIVCEFSLFSILMFS